MQTVNLDTRLLIAYQWLTDHCDILRSYETSHLRKDSFYANINATRPIKNLRIYSGPPGRGKISFEMIVKKVTIFGILWPPISLDLTSTQNSKIKIQM